MGFPIGLDLDLLRSFVVIAEERSFTRAAERVGRTQSAVSLQMQRLEAALGQTLLERGKGGSVQVNAQGQFLLTRARDILALNDDIVKSIRAVPVHGTVRLGMTDELAVDYLPRILAGFTEQAPAVQVEVAVSPSCVLSHRLKAGELDLVILEQGLEPRQWPARPLLTQKLCWISSDQHRQHLRDPLPICVSTGDCQWRPPWLAECLWRGMTFRALDQAGRKYRIVSTSGTVSGQLAAAQAGLAVVVGIDNGQLTRGLRVLRDDEGLPSLPGITHLLLKAREPRQPVTDMLAALIEDLFDAEPVTPP